MNTQLTSSMAGLQEMGVDSRYSNIGARLRDIIIAIELTQHFCNSFDTRSTSKLDFGSNS